MTKENIIQKFHDELDIERGLLNFDLEQNIIQEDEMKSDLEKAIALKKLGFTSSPSTIKGNNTLNKITLSKEQLEYLKKYSRKYPNSKFITEDRFNKIRDNFGLKYDKVEHYSESVSDDMFDQITTKRKLDVEDYPDILYEMKPLFDNHGALKRFCKLKGKDKPCFSNAEVRDSHAKYRGDVPSHWFFGESGESMVFYDELRHYGISIGSFKAKKVSDKQGLYILAPYSSFNNGNLNIFSKAFFNSFFNSFNEPLVFQFCKGGFIRIITDWEHETQKKESEFIQSDIK